MTEHTPSQQFYTEVTLHEKGMDLPDGIKGDLLILSMYFPSPGVNLDKPPSPSDMKEIGIPTAIKFMGQIPLWSEYGRVSRIVLDPDPIPCAVKTMDAWNEYAYGKRDNPLPETTCFTYYERINWRAVRMAAYKSQDQQR